MLREAFRKTIKHTIIFGLGKLSSRAVGLVLIPVYTRFILPSDYGVLALVTMIGSIVTICLEMGLCTAIFRYYFLYKEEADRKIVISCVFFWILSIGMVLTVILIITSEYVSTIFLKSPIYSPYLVLMYLITYIHALKNIPLAVMRAKEKSILYSVLSVIDLLFGIILNICFVVILKREVMGILEAGLIAGILTAPIFFIFIKNEIKLRISPRILMRILKFGLPLVPAGLASMVLTLSSRYFLMLYSSFEEVGLYTLGQKIGTIISIILVQPLQLIWPTMMYSISDKKEAGEFFSRILVYFLVVTGGIAFVISVFSSEIISIVAPETYLESFRVIPLISFSFVLYGIYFITTIGLNLREKTYYLPWIVGCASIANLFLNYALIPKFGMMGAGLGVFTSYIILIIINYLVNQRFYRVVYNFWKISPLLIIFIFTIIAFSYPITLNIFLKLVYVGGYVIFVWKVILDNKERIALVDMAKSAARIIHR